MSNTNPACNKWPATAPFFGGPFPTRTWFRAGGAPCSGTAATRALAKKTEVLQYKGNSAQLTQKQKWAQFAKGKSHNKKQSWASQTQTVTNPNVNNLYQVRNTLICEECPTKEVVGDQNVDSQAKANALRGVTKITGTLTITGNVTDLSPFDCLKEITDNFNNRQ